MYKILKGITILVWLFFGCAAQKPKIEKGTLKGVTGVYEGNCMPGPGRPPCEPRPVSITILITDVSESYDENKLVKKIKSDDNGEYQTDLPVGRYSLFLNDADQVVCTIIQCPETCICHPFEIKSDSTTTIDANLDHAVW
ncbi:hypothetical protein SAMN05421640_3590 [Ekhidna lutea]|uniref:Carboxypeptidase regulatory-like domain-containing protein n=1 Tax=Ekhidna lutea TaxID=447679 RepID=A0A239M3D2_EKHLU|nr:hypothetical protein [Ekhidna lutea]SNT36762.1 hypothetical protein SAMN05421640_3590 [Ekhidna lutea]